jgi:acetyl-CoA carboxylase carboxyl transferase subunit beta
MAFFSKPKYSTISPSRKKDIPKDLYTQDPKNGELIYTKELEKNLMVSPKSGHHFPFDAPRRIKSLIDAGTWEEFDQGISAVDSLGFKDHKAYADRLKAYKAATGLNEAVICGLGEMESMLVSLAVMDFRFGGASMGAAVGEKITRAVERGLEKQCPVIIVSASGGARMQEGIYSLMQMAKTSAALARLADAKLPYISILTHPTTGGVTASFATLGDLNLAEPEALICFAGPRVIKEGTNEELPPGFQRAEFLLERGLIDQIVPRPEMRDRVAGFLKAFMANRASA